MQIYTVIFMALLCGILESSDAQSVDQVNTDQVVQNECAPYCLRYLLKNTEYMNTKLAACEKRNLQMSVLQSQLAVLKFKENICDKTMREQENKCKSQEQLDADVNSLKNLMIHLTTQSKNDAKKLKDLLKQMDELRTEIDEKNFRIISLETKLRLIDTYKSDLKSMPIDLSSIQPESHVKIYNKNCLNNVDTTEILEILVPDLEPFPVLCDATIAGPGWTVIQQRVDDSEDFNRNWTDYRNGFGVLERNFFIGLEKLHRMTKSQPHELYIKLYRFYGEERYARYNNFSIGGESEDYALKSLGEYSGTANDSMKSSINMKFSTFDRDNDRSYGNCARDRNGGWWYNQCALTNLNGRYYEREMDKWDGIWWYDWLKFLTLEKVQMLIRPINTTAAQSVV